MELTNAYDQHKSKILFVFLNTSLTLVNEYIDLAVFTLIAGNS